MHVWQMPLHQQPKVVTCAIADHGQTLVERFWLPRVWTLHVYAYSAELILDGFSHQIRPGMAGVIAPGVQQEYRYQGISRHTYAHFELPTGGDTVPVPMLYDLADAAVSFNSRFAAAIGDFAVTPMRCHVRVWDLLWELARHGERAGHGGSDPRLAEVMMHIERELERPLSVPELAHRVGLSHNQLTRIFTARNGDTVVGYIRRRRIEKAVYLLTHTQLPIAAIAAQVGIPDAQAFSKTMRAIAGRAPSEFRS